MDFSEAYKQSGPAAWSPDGKYIAVAVGYRLVVRESESLEVLQLFSCLDKIEHISWAPNSTCILCALYKRSIVQAWNIELPDWSCKIDEGPAGLAYARWSPDGLNILTTASFNIRITVWSLSSKSAVYLKFPKFASKGLGFSHSGEFMAVAERRDCKDSITIFSTKAWEIVGTFRVETTDLADLSWCPDGSCICVIDSCLEYRMLIYSLDGRCLKTFQAYYDALGIKSFSWSPSGQLLAIGSYDQGIRVLNNLTWNSFAECFHKSPITARSGCVVYEEVEEKVVEEADQANGIPSVRASYVISEFPVSIPQHKAPTDKANPKMGVGLLEWSWDNKYLATRNDNMPTAVFVWDTTRFELAAVLLQKDAIRRFQWSPTKTQLTLCTANSRVYTWSPDGASCVHIPLEDFSANDVKWSPHGNAFLLTDKDRFTVSYLD